MRVASLSFMLLVLAGISGAQDTNFAIGPQYLMTNGSPLFARPIATPTVSLGEAPANVAPASSAGEQAFTTPPQLQGQANLFPIYYGTAPVSVIEISAAEPPRALPVSFMESGVVQTTDAQSLRQRGFGVTLSDAAAYQKAHRAHAPRVFTNSDIERLHGG